MAQRTTKVTIDISKITSTQSILDELRMLSERLPHTNLRELLAFNNAYYTVTMTIAEASRANRFSNPDFIDRFSICFAAYYFEAINMYSQGDLSLAPAWIKAIQPPRKGSIPVFVSLLLGANAHINYDLPLALADTIRNSKNNNFLKDISKVDKLLIKSGKQIVNEFEESNRLISFIKRRGKFLYLRPIMWMVLYWRVMAWRQYGAIKRNRKDAERIARRSTKIANRLMWFGAHFG